MNVFRSLNLTLAFLASASVAGASNLYVAFESGTTVGEYDATMGAVINAGFTTGFSAPFGLELAGSNLYVSDFGSTTVGEYDATTGAAVNANFAPVSRFRGWRSPATTSSWEPPARLANTTPPPAPPSIPARSPGINGPNGLAISSGPEPSTWVTLAAGLALLAAMLRKRARIA